jgi:hypothetical protein
MITVLTLPFAEDVAELHIEGCETVQMHALPNQRSLPYDVVITAFGTSQTYKQFVPCHVSSAPHTFTTTIHPLLDCVLGDREMPFMALVGLYEVLFIHCLRKTMHPVLKLFRQADEDQGFYRQQILALSDGFVLIYESGAARIKHTGDVVWHERLAWDDIFLKKDDTKLYYSSEFGEFAPHDWTIEMADGSRVPLQTG